MSSGGSPRTPSSSGAMRSVRRAAVTSAAAKGGTSTATSCSASTYLPPSPTTTHRAEDRVDARADHEFVLAAAHGRDDHALLRRAEFGQLGPLPVEQRGGLRRRADVQRHQAVLRLVRHVARAGLDHRRRAHGGQRRRRPPSRCGTAGAPPPAPRPRPAPPGSALRSGSARSRRAARARRSRATARSPCASARCATPVVPACPSASFSLA